MTGLLAIFLLTLLAGVASPAGATAPLALDDVLRSSAAHYPEVIEALAKREAADGRALSARGAFDLVFDAEGKANLSGFYDGTEAGLVASKELGPFGARVYGGYRISRGSFPIYRDAAFTDQSGEAKVGVVFSLLRDREIDRRRMGLRNAEIDLELADFDLMLTRVGVQQRAADAYFSWVAAIRQLHVYEDLAALAEGRQNALQREVRAGARAAIYLTENAQNIARRRVLVVEAAQWASVAANNLSLFYRDASGAPIVPDGRMAPLARNGAVAMPTPSGERPEVGEIFSRRPDIQMLEALVEKSRNKVLLAENELKPRLDVSYEASNDFGAEGRGGPSRDGAENIVGLKFSVPFQRREARGALDASRADLEALEQRRRLLKDRAEVEFRNIVLNADMAEQRAILVAQEVEQSDQLEAAERKRFASGASDFFLVNLREETAANARVRLHKADFDRAVALSAFLAATMDVEALGLSSGGRLSAGAPSFGSGMFLAE